SLMYFIYTFFIMLILVLFFFFFFQAEDGIRDGHVTGVQTCALPICLSPPRGPDCWVFTRNAEPMNIVFQEPEVFINIGMGQDARSEERRVGKECRSRRGGDQ